LGFFHLHCGSVLLKLFPISDGRGSVGFLARRLPACTALPSRIICVPFFFCAIFGFLAPQGALPTPLASRKRVSKTLFLPTEQPRLAFFFLSDFLFRWRLPLGFFPPSWGGPFSDAIVLSRLSRILRRSGGSVLRGFFLLQAVIGSLSSAVRGFFLRPLFLCFVLIRGGQVSSSFFFFFSPGKYLFF